MKLQLTKIKLPHTLALIFIIMICVALLTWIIPGGNYDRTTNEDGREIVVDGTFHSVEGRPQGIPALLKSPVTGIIQTADIIGLILVLGGAFSIIQKTKVIDDTISRVAARLQNRGFIVIPIGMVLFSVFGAVFGMSEEVIPFVLIFIPLSLALGYDSIIGVAIPFIGAGLGFAGAMLNPFTIGIAQGISELPLFSGITYRIIVWFISTLVGTALIMLYAAKIKKNPKASPVYAIDQQRRQATFQNQEESIVFTIRHKLIIILFGVTILAMIVGVMRYQWFIVEIGAIFLGLGIASGLIAKLSINDIAESFVAGAKDLVGAALVVGFARAIVVIASDGQIIDTIMSSLSGAISRYHPVFAAQIMFVIQSVLNFFIPSGSGKAALTMPIMAPLADLIGITRQTAVLAFQLGDGYTNMIIPTSGVTMGVLGMAKLPWDVWAKWLLPIEVVLFILGLLLLIPPVLFQWGPF